MLSITCMQVVVFCVMRGLPSTLGSTSRSLGSGNTPQQRKHFLMLTESARSSHRELSHFV